MQVKLLQSVHILPQQSLQVAIQLPPDKNEASVADRTVIVEPTPTLKYSMGIVMEDALLHPSEDGLVHTVLMNSTAFTQTIEAGTQLGRTSHATLVKPPQEDDHTNVPANVKQLSSKLPDTQRKDLLLQLVGQPDLPAQEQADLMKLLQEYHSVFALEEGERGQTDLVEVEIDTGDAQPLKQPPRRMPFAVRKEIAKQVKNMQETGVAVPSNSPWASPVVMVRKKDGTHRLCVDYRCLNATTKADQFPIPRIDDLLDQLGKSKYFSTLDLAAGYWQIPLHPDSQAKTAFTTPSGLYEFKSCHLV